MFKNFKRKISLIVAGACMLSILPVSESNHITAEEKIEDKTTATTVSETTTTETEEVEVLHEYYNGNIKYVITSDGVLTISGEGEMHKCYDIYVEEINPQYSEAYFTNLQPYLYKYSEQVKTIKFEDGVTQIADYLFAQNFSPLGYEEEVSLNKFPNLETVILSNTSIVGRNSFYGLEIENLIIPSEYKEFSGFSMNYNNIYVYNPTCEIYDYEYSIRQAAAIYGYENSTAYDYAKKYGRTFYAFDKEEPLLTAPAVTTTITTASTTTAVSTTVSTTVSKTITEETEEVEVLFEYEWDGFIFTITSDGIMTVSGEGEMKSCYSTNTEGEGYDKVTYTYLQQPYFYEYSEQVKTIKFEDGITWIADYLFATNYEDAGWDLFFSTPMNKFPILETVILSNTSIVGRNSFYGLEIENLIVPSEYENYYVLYNGYLDINNVYFYNPKCNIGDTESTVNPKAIIHGYEDSTAYDYAKKYGRTFYAFDKEEPLLTAPAVTTTITTASTTTAVSTTVSTTVSKTASNTTSASETVSNTVSTTVSTTVSETTTSATTTVTTTTETVKISGDANGDNKLDVRDCAYIASMLASGTGDKLPKTSDFNGDGVVNVRDAAAIAKKLADKNI